MSLEIATDSIITLNGKFERDVFTSNSPNGSQDWTKSVDKLLRTKKKNITDEIKKLIKKRKLSWKIDNPSILMRSRRLRLL